MTTAQLQCAASDLIDRILHYIEYLASTFLSHQRCSHFYMSIGIGTALQEEQIIRESTFHITHEVKDRIRYTFTFDFFDLSDLIGVHISTVLYHSADEFLRFVPWQDRCLWYSGGLTVVQAHTVFVEPYRDRHGFTEGKAFAALAVFLLQESHHFFWCLILLIFSVDAFSTVCSTAACTQDINDCFRGYRHHISSPYMDIRLRSRHWLCLDFSFA